MTNYPLDEQKLIYRVLHQHLTQHPELMDCQFLDDLQRDLQKTATAEGVDCSDHGQWDDWLGNAAVSCDIRMSKRRTL